MDTEHVHQLITPSLSCTVFLVNFNGYDQLSTSFFPQMHLYEGLKCIYFT